MHSQWDQRDGHEGDAERQDKPVVKEELADSGAEERAGAEHRDKANAEWRRSRVVASADRHEAERRARKEERRERKRLEAEHAKKLKDKQLTANDREANLTSSCRHAGVMVPW